MAAIVLRRNFSSTWKSAGPPTKASFKQLVVDSLTREQHEQVSNAVGFLISQVQPFAFCM
jgi:hypothetical protein